MHIETYSTSELKNLYKDLRLTAHALPRYGLPKPKKEWQPTKSYLGWRLTLKRMMHTLEVRAFLQGRLPFVSTLSPSAVHVDMVDRLISLNNLYLYKVVDLVGVSEDSFKEYRYDLLITDVEMIEEEFALTTMAEFERHMQEVGDTNWRSKNVTYRVTDWDALTGLHRNRIDHDKRLPSHYAWWYYNDAVPTQGIRVWWRILGIPLELALDGLEDAYVEAHRQGKWEKDYKLSIKGNIETRKLLMNPWDV
jgi:hypothetical protein